MDVQAIFLLQFVLSLLVTGLLAKWTLAPWLEKRPEREALFWLVVPHAFRPRGHGVPGSGSAGPTPAG
jgi:hypothetical protein